ncbi:MAG: hypothetical protein HYZ22_04185 [Chloroflexi bacterium]|nr:hypothetical protein [Chloroflexota bacterium]
MYQQYPNPITSAAKWIFFGFFGIILMGFLLGANLKEATWLNSGIAAAQAEKTRMETAHQSEMNKLQEQLTAAQTDAEIQRIRREQERLNAQHAHDLQVLNQDIANRQRWADFKINAATILSIGAGVLAALSIFTLVVAKSVAMVRAVPSAVPVIPARRTVPEIQKIPSVPEREPYDPWASPDYRRQQRDAAKKEERKEREEVQALANRMKSFSDPARMSSAEYYKHPLAGD